MSEILEKADFLIVGAGSTGAVIANRLSEDNNRRVLLLEAGPDQPRTEAVARAMRNANQVAMVPGLNWKIRTLVKGDDTLSSSANPAMRGAVSMFDYEAGKIVGGSSAINATQALRGAPIDYDEWAVEGGEGWGWSEVLPYFRALEDDPIGPDTLHGYGGPMPIRREHKEELTPLQAGLMEACIAHGFAETPDHNDPQTTGVGIIPKNVVDGVRISTAQTYLTPVQARTNLKIVTDALVHRLLWNSSTKCEGVEVQVNGSVRRFFADNVILCAGALNTPAILMRSGVGNPMYLEPLGIAVVSPLIGVGENLMDHPVVGIWGMPKPGVCTAGEPLRQTLLRYSSSASGYANDMHICLMGGLNISEMFPARASISKLSTIAGVTASFNKSMSRGYVRIASANPTTAPRAALNCLGDKNDVAPLKEGIRLAWELLQHPRLRPQYEQILAWTDGMVNSDVALERAIKTFVRPSAHLCGSARMGRSPDAGAVVDRNGRVYSVDNLWVADASIMPRIPSAPPHLTCLMMAEKISAQLQRCYT